MDPESVVFIGHFGLGLGLKRAAPGVSLGTLFLAVEFADLLWPTLLLFGVERVKIAAGITALTPLDFVAWAGHAQRLLVAAGYWVDRHRSSYAA